MVWNLILMLGFIFTTDSPREQTNLYKISDGKASFKSEAPLELINASTELVAGLLDADRKAFAISVQVSGFTGFNSALQREHFNENYVESSKYPKSFYKGLIVDDIDLTVDGIYEVKTKGKFNLHGVEKVQSADCTVEVNGNEISVSSTFDVSLSDHNIKIPTVVVYKLSEVIKVTFEATFKLKK